ncbi:diadenylate cyclase CdaA [Halanaerocella petrolearia]
MELNFVLILDVLFTLVVVYKFFSIIRETRAIQLLKGILFLFLITFISQKLGFRVFNYLLEQIRTVALIAIPVIFQPELRRALEQIGRDYLTRHNKVETKIDQLLTAVIKLSESQTGGLIVLKRNNGLQEVIETGVKLGANLSAELLISIFTPKTPLHDGAVIVEEKKIVAANCLLPLTESKKLGSSLGTRHRAALGVSEESDAIVLVVSEETGVISLAREGKFKYNLDEFALKEELFKDFKG